MLLSLIASGGGNLPFLPFLSENYGAQAREIQYVFLNVTVSLKSVRARGVRPYSRRNRIEHGVDLGASPLLHAQCWEGSHTPPQERSSHAPILLGTL